VTPRRRSEQRARSSGLTWRWARRASAPAEDCVIETSRKAGRGDFKRLDDGSPLQRFADLDDMADLAECIRKQET
jgi:hypothetical protein